ncbi:P-loop NTPase fold protein [Picosynechococcus sp. PCC 7117]|uniref:P-loop NTPase fold protein n=1 Tax=Picosynechococcus sp. PCC 7117 TaxID=195498 RepID=UPI000810ED7D|nr:P-loop NTPase fold protein [Picosynechococcus sp. PCC 7117]ANV86963.1 hypothetical protein AWQ22_05495 [Picosynechococcus sp. PCC 7117]
MFVLTREDALKRLEQIQKKYDRDTLIRKAINEAETRLLIIDEILSLLGWAKDDFCPEHTVKNVGFIDYLITADNIPRFIVEAKRVGQTFIYPTKKLQKSQYSLGYMRTAFGQSLTEVITQAEGYSQEKGVPFSVLTNGAEWILIQTHRTEQKKLNDLNCFYFGNLLADSSRFNLLWELLSKPSVLDGSLEENFSQINISSAEFVLSPDSKLPEIQWKIDRDINHKYIRDFYDYFFGEIIDSGRKKMLKKCFISNSKLDQYQKEMKQVLQDARPTYIPDIEDIEPDHENVPFLNSYTGDQKGKVILVVGSVGCGKSTFVNKILDEEQEKERGSNQESENISIILDLINEFDGTSDTINRYLWDLIDKEWKEREPESYKYKTLRKIFGRELKLLHDGPYATLFEKDPELLMRKEAERLDDLSSLPETFLSNSWKYYRQTKKKGIILFLDNIDRTSDNYQRFVYTFSHKIASRTGATVIVTMREGTYFRGKKFGFLDVRSDDIVYHLQTPNRVKIISKRIEYVKNLESYSDSGEKDYRLSKWKQRKDWSEFRAACLIFAETLKATFLTSCHSSQALGLLNAVSWHNLRSFLTLLKDLHTVLGNDRDGWSISYIISALTTANIDEESKSILPNIYFPIFREYPCYFLKVRIVLMLMYGKHPSELRKGISLNELLTFTKVYGYQERWSNLAIQEMVKERLIECMEIPTEKDFTKDYQLSDNHTFRAAPLAVAMAEKIFCDKIYLLAVGREIPFHSERLFNQYIDLVKDFFEIVHDIPFTKEGISLFLETKAYKVVARFLIEQLEKETPPHSKQFPTISNVESQLEVMIRKLRKIAEMLTTRLNIPQSHPVNQQEYLFDTAEYENQCSPKLITEVPQEFTYYNSNISRLPPKIFWALVELKAREQEWVTGAEITRIINQYLVDDLNQVESTNISKALRGKELRAMKWLIHKKVADKKTLYKVSDDWVEYWSSFFQDSPPPTLL